MQMSCFNATNNLAAWWLTAGLGDIMLTCYGSLSRNRTVGVRLGQGEKLADILGSSSQVAEGVPTAGEYLT